VLTAKFTGRRILGVNLSRAFVGANTSNNLRQAAGKMFSIFSIRPDTNYHRVRLLPLELVSRPKTKGMYDGDI
jgi:hypothetical protein